MIPTVTVWEAQPRWTNRLTRASTAQPDFELIWHALTNSNSPRNVHMLRRPSLIVCVPTPESPELVLELLNATCQSQILLIIDTPLETELQLRELGIHSILPTETPPKEVLRTLQRLLA